MSYITAEDIEARLGVALVDRLVDNTNQRASILADVIARAESRVDGYLSGRYATPVPTSGLIEEAALSVAEHELYRRADGPVPEKVRKAYEDALKDLRDIASGKIALGSATAPSDPDADEDAGIQIDSVGDTLFDPASMKDAGW